MTENAAKSRRLGRPPLNEVASGERRTAILRAAATLFQGRGYAAVSLAEVAAEVGVTTATVLHHFGSKEGLYAAVMRETLTLIGAAIRETATGPASAPDKLQAMARSAIVDVHPDADLDSMMRDAGEHLNPEHLTEVEDAYRAMIDAVERVMHDGITAGELIDRDPALLAHAYWWLLSGFSGRAGTRANFQGKPEIADAVVDLFLRGAAP